MCRVFQLSANIKIYLIVKKISVHNIFSSSWLGLPFGQNPQDFEGDVNKSYFQLTLAEVILR